jgi:hypothetical protein
MTKRPIVQPADAEPHASDKSERAMPRISQARGGLIAGVDLHAMQGAEDLDDILRPQRRE